MAAMQDYRIHLDTYSGPMDLLLYLIRRDEVDIYDIPISRILEQYLAHVQMLKEIDPDAVGEFLVLAATLMEIKSRLLLPKPPPEESDEAFIDPRADLVRQLLAYRACREAAAALHRRADEHSRRFGRPPVDLPGGEASVDLEEVQIWDLLAVFNRLLASAGRQTVTHDVVYDDTPIALHAADILDRLVRDGPAMAFERIFEGRTRGEMIGLFLALLELIRQQRVRVQQETPLGGITVHLIDPTPITEIWEPDDGDREDAGAEDEQAFEPQAAGEAAEPLFEEEDAGEDDEFSRRIDAVRIGEVDLGRGPAAEAEPPPEESGEEK